MIPPRRRFRFLAFLAMTSIMAQAASQLEVKVTAARCRHPRAVQAPDGTLYVYGALKSNDGGKFFWPVEESDPAFGAYLHAEKLTSLFWRKGLFLGFYLASTGMSHVERLVVVWEGCGAPGTE